MECGTTLETILDIIGMNRDKFYIPTDTSDNTHTVMFVVFNVLIVHNSEHFTMYVFLKVKAVQ
jgi:hypothetical protein